ncbi:MAG: 5-formyltetrahydrofolate cyclo-ligase [Sphingomonadaceae bacterium]|nr:5-formyltetrahydrofolate cyclo-ligase [Sphingomonadaceae bacterium]
MAVPSPSKAELRRTLKSRRQAFVAAIPVAERCVAAAVLRAIVLPRIMDAGIVAAYLPIGAEIDPLPLIRALSSDGRSIALPHVTGRLGALRFLRWAPGDPLVAGPMGLLQPEADADAVAPDAILAPLLGFDATLHRIGYGAGHYDRAFAAHPDARRIGLAWSCQRVEAIPRDGWDVSLHAVATEREWIGG